MLVVAVVSGSLIRSVKMTAAHVTQVGWVDKSGSCRSCLDGRWLLAGALEDLLADREAGR